MKSVTFTEFRKNASSIISDVENGEVIQVIRHGKAVAEITPVKEQRLTLPSWKKRGLRLSIKGGSLSEALSLIHISEPTRPC